MLLIIVFKLLTCVVLCFGQQESTQQDVSPLTFELLSEAIGNFSLELLCNIANKQTDNIIMSPFNIWSALAVTAEGALLKTRKELNDALRLSKNRTIIRIKFQEIAREYNLNTTTIKLYWFNGIFLHNSVDLERDYRQIARTFNTFLFQVNFTDPANSASLVNRAVSVATKNRMNKLVDENDFSDAGMLVTSAAYFRGHWTTHFNVLSSAIQPFYDSNGIQTGEVNMMYSRHTYRFVDVPGIESKVIELPYGSEEQVSLIIILPYPGVSLNDMFRKFIEVPLNVIFSKPKLYQQEHGQVKVDCFIPRFSIESSLELKDTLKYIGINSLFDGRAANLGRMSRTKTHVSKVVQKALIEVSEEGINAPEIDSQFENTTGVPRFEANRPFAYFVIGNKLNTIMYLGIFQRPFLY